MTSAHDRPRPGGRRARVPRRSSSPTGARSRCTATGCSARCTTPRTRCRRRCCARGARSTASSGARRCAPGSTGSRPTPAWTSCERRPRRGRGREVEPYPDAAARGRLLAPRRRPGGALRAARGAWSSRSSTAIQRLPGRQRAVLILRDVLGWSAAEVAELLDTTRRRGQQRAAARPRRDRLGPVTPHALARGPRMSASAAGRYVDVWDRADMDGLSTCCARMRARMPPGRHIDGAPAIGRFWFEPRGDAPCAGPPTRDSSRRAPTAGPPCASTSAPTTAASSRSR